MARRHIIAYVLAALAFLAVTTLPSPPDVVPTLEELRSLGYLDTAPTDNPDETGVTLRLDGAFVGLNLISSRHSASAHLADMRGRVLHTWTDTRQAPWMHVEMRPNGDLFALVKDRFLVKLNWGSEVLWRCSTRAHHDFTVAPDGRIYVISRDSTHAVVAGAELPVLADKIVVVSPRGKIEREVPLFELLQPFIPARRLQDLQRAEATGVSFRKLTTPESYGDLTHTNSIIVMDRAIPEIAPAGSILLSVREINRIVIIDRAMTRVLWSWGRKELQEQHHATLLHNGNILVFDNGTARKRSRVLEVDPRTREIVWSYSTPDFYTRLRGAAQKLPNGNVLATESDSGHAIEVTPAGTIVWEFWNPDIRRSEGKKPERAALYRLVRYERSYLRLPLAEAQR